MRAACLSTIEVDPPAKPKGGYRIIHIPILAAAWVAYRLKLIRLVDLRVWFAFHEMDARRCLVEHPLIGKFTTHEARKLTGLSAKRIKDSLRRLQDARLVEWTPSGLSFPDSAGDSPVTKTLDFQTFLDGIPNPNRKVPVPRRTLRLLAGGARPALIATVLGHLIRGLYLKQGKCLGRGRVKASWIAEIFGIGLRRVKEARSDLIAMGWIIPLEADQWALNRWGAHYWINLEWSRLTGVETDTEASTRGPELAPPTAISDPQMAPPDSDMEPLVGRHKNQKPASGGPAGICVSILEVKTLEPKPASSHVPMLVPPASAMPPVSVAPSTPGKPNLQNVVIEDLKDTGRLLNLHDQAIAKGWITSSERDRLRFIGAAEHARTIGTKNPCGLFFRLIRCGLWSFITQDDEDAASARLKRHLHGKPLERSTAGVQVKRAAECLSDDALTVRSVRAAVAGAGYRGDAFPCLKRQYPEWTRERWDRALQELAR